MRKLRAQPDLGFAIHLFLWAGLIATASAAGVAAYELVGPALF